MTKITINRAVVEQVLEAMRHVVRQAQENLVPTIHYGSVHDVMNNLSAALAQEQAEPYAGKAARLNNDRIQIDPVTGNVSIGAERAEPVQEPVAKVEMMMTGGNAGLATRIVEIDDHLRERLRPGQLLYTAPPQRKPLTDGEIKRIDDSTHFHESPDWSLRFARAIERAHGIE